MAVEQTPGGQVSSGDVEIITRVTGPARFEIVARAIFDSAPARVWILLKDWREFVAVGLPGLTENFTWLKGGPDEVPSAFEFDLAGARLKEEIYERTADENTGRYRLRYRTLEPALGVLEYDAVLELQRVADARTAFSATRSVRLVPDAGPQMLADVIRSETQHLKDYFAL